jgi:hypothetical protein
MLGVASLSLIDDGHARLSSIFSLCVVLSHVLFCSVDGMWGLAGFELYM